MLPKHMLRTLIICLAAVLLVGMALQAPPARTASPDTFTVCATGCDFTTIQAALDDERVGAGATIQVMDPVHTEAGITVRKDVTIQGQGADKTIVQAHETVEKTPARVFLVPEGVTVTLRDMTRDLAWSEVLEKAAEACRKLVGQVEARSEAELRSTETLPWQKGRSLWRLIAGSGYIHPMAMHVCPMHIARGDKAYATRLQEEGAQLLGELDEGRDWHGLIGTCAILSTAVISISQNPCAGANGWGVFHFS